jgi:predicted nuclease of predicted toxin-antitoxin system
MNQRPDARLLLDEMFSPAIAAELRALGHDVIAVADRSDLRAKSDEEIFAWASAERRWLLTENVKDFRPIMLRAVAGGQLDCGLLFTSSRAFPRSRKNPGPLINALHVWLAAGPPAPPVTESWLLDASGSS